MKKEEEKQLIDLMNKLRNDFCKRYNCCFDKDQGRHYYDHNEKSSLCPLCYNGRSNCMCDDILWWAFRTKLTEKRHPRIASWF